MSDPPASYPEEVRETFEYCEDCDTLVVGLDQHRCAEPSSGRPSASERTELAAADDRPQGEDVLYPKGRSQNNAWAYHELDDDGEPLHAVDHLSGTERGSRGEAIKAGCYPCGRCRRIQEAADE